MHSVEFPPFRLDVAAERLWREQHMVALRPKSVAVLYYLMTQRERVVPHAELRRAVWPDVVVRICAEISYRIAIAGEERLRA